MQFLRLNETCRMIGYSLLSNDVSLSGYDVKSRFCAFHSFYEEVLVALDTYAKKINPPLLVFFGEGY